MSTFDPTKPVQTRDGRKARILLTNLAGNEYPIVAVYEDEEGDEYSETYRLDGYCYSSRESDKDLVNIPVVPCGYRGEQTKYFNTGHSYGSAHCAQKAARGWPVVEITFKDGEYLSHVFHEELPE